MGHNFALGKLLIKPSTWARLVLTGYCGMDNSDRRRTIAVAEGVWDHIHNSSHHLACQLVTDKPSSVLQGGCCHRNRSGSFGSLIEARSWNLRAVVTWL